MLWSLYIDESGSFDQPDDEVVVAGVLLRDDVERSWRPAAEAKLRQRCADHGLPWPLHAAHFNNVVLFALGAAARALGQANPVGPVPGPAGTVLAHLAAAGLEDLARRATEDLAVGRLPAIPVLRKLEHARLGAPGHVKAAWRGLEDLRDLLVAELRWNLCLLLNRQDHPRPGLVVVGGETERGDAPRDWRAAGRGPDEPLSRKAHPQERYLPLLGLAAQRASWLLEAIPGEHEVQVHPLTRPGWGHALVTRRDVSAALARFPPARACRLVANTPRDYHDAPLPWVLADFICNRARWGLRDAGEKPVTAVEASLQERAGVRVASPMPHRSHLAATGRARRAGTEPGGSGARRWALEQGREWAAIRAGRS